MQRALSAADKISALTHFSLLLHDISPRFADEIPGFLRSTGTAHRRIDSHPGGEYCERWRCTRVRYEEATFRKANFH
jgi:hypothetical protein